MNRKNIAYFVIIISTILLLGNIYTIGFENLFSKKILSPISNILIIIAMLFNLRELKNKKNN